MDDILEFGYKSLPTQVTADSLPSNRQDQYFIVFILCLSVIGIITYKLNKDAKNT